ncbi:penicillin-binding protein 2 [Agrococcus sp. SCSIO52902]|uniref:peptidoglycan D,D-transpeptidase FtsI family protein n=1 Tax=Agrococcus sp. SCSIO52902 TaxID=2933290 RepID=UPI001FF6DB2D|nr:penicillin-binding protein 2 [Agrococcus sp. SCSIO52902]UOW00213.1 penicillin-binding protein 2 [Agrococcus sp. SCSIO52902]
MAAKRNRSRDRVRTTIIAVLTFAMLAGFVVRLADIQLVRAEALNAEADGRRGVSQTIFGTRGPIVDSTGTVLAESVDRWDLTVSPRYTRDLQPDLDGVEAVVTVGDALTEIGRITGDDPLDLQARIYAELERNPDSDYLMLSSGLDVEQFEAVQALDLPYVYLRLNPQRLYPAGSVAGNLVGFMGQSEPLAGIERSQDECLASEPGSRVFDRSADGTPIPGSMLTEPAVDGGTVELTIDSDVQYQVQQLTAQYTTQLRARSGTSIVMRTDGSIVAVAESPTVDPNEPSSSEQQDRGSRAFTAAYEPGSIFKTFSFAAMLDLGLITPRDELSVPWTYTAPGVRVRDASSHPVEQWTAAGILVNSSNSGMVRLAEQMDRGDYFEYLDRFGFGEQTAVGFAGEQSVPLRDASALDPQTSLNVLFGQGIATTPIQIASAYQALANGGVHLPARLIEGCTDAAGEVTRPEQGQGERVVTDATARQTLEVLENVVTDYGYDTFPIDGYRIAAKTGTAQMAYENGGGYDPDRMMISVAGVFPVDDPQYVVVTMYDSPQTLRTSAGAIPAFHDMVNLLIRHYDIPPSTTQPPEVPLEWTAD